MSEITNILPIILSISSFLGIIIVAITAWIKFSEMAKASKEILDGYRHKDGSSIFRTTKECNIMHQETVDTTCRKIDEIKENINDSRMEAREIRSDLKRDIGANKTMVTDMFLEIKEFMGSTVKAIDNLEETTKRR